jgi:hypothetical protein
MIELEYTKARSFNTISHKEQKEILQTLKKDRTEKKRVVGELRKKMMDISIGLRTKLNALRDGMCKLRELNVPEDLPQDVKDLAHTIKEKATAYCKARPTLEMLKKGATSKPFEFESLHEDDQKDPTYHPKPGHFQTHLTTLKKIQEAHEKEDRKKTKEATIYRTRMTKKKNKRDARSSRTYTLDSSEEEEEYAQPPGSGEGGRSVQKKPTFSKAPKAPKEEMISLLEEEEEEEDLADLFSNKASAQEEEEEEEEEDLAELFSKRASGQEEEADLSRMSMPKFKWTPTFSVRPDKAKTPRSFPQKTSSKKSKKK